MIKALPEIADAFWNWFPLPVSQFFKRRETPVLQKKRNPPASSHCLQPLTLGLPLPRKADEPSRQSEPTNHRGTTSDLLQRLLHRRRWPSQLRLSALASDKKTHRLRFSTATCDSSPLLPKSDPFHGQVSKHLARNRHITPLFCFTRNSALVFSSTSGDSRSRLFRMQLPSLVRRLQVWTLRPITELDLGMFELLVFYRLFDHLHDFERVNRLGSTASLYRRSCEPTTTNIF